MKPDDLRPTRAALHNDDGRSDYQPGHRRMARGAFGWDNTYNERRKTGETPQQRDRRYRAERRVDPARRERDRATAAAYDARRRKSKSCLDCGRPIDPGASRCQPCASREGWRRRNEWKEQAKRELAQEYRNREGRVSPTHERNVLVLQSRLPL